jgi:putative ABC transport system permease protein
MFDLERAIKEWKKSLRRSPAIQDGDIVELEGYLRDKIEDLRGQGLSEEEAFKKAESEFARSEKLDGDYYRAGTRKWSGRPPWQAPRFMPELLWNFLKVPMRRLRRQWGSSFINVLSLAIGLACFVMFFMSWTYERSFDKSIPKASRIYRLDQKTAGGESREYNGMYNFLAPVLEKRVPEVEDTTRFAVVGQGLIRHGRKILKQHVNFFYAESSLFRVFSPPVAKGDPRTMLESPDSIVLSESSAKSLFGDDDPMGKTVEVIIFSNDDKNRSMDFQVRGILKDQPSALTERFEVIIPFMVKNRFDPNTQPIWEYRATTYVLVKDRVPMKDLERKIRTLALSAAGPLSVKSNLSSLNNLILTPLTAIHLADKDLGRYLAIFAVIALAVLFLAGINFVNLSTALAVKRIREIGVRKIVGAGRAMLVRQFIGESVLMAFLALGLALLAIGLALPMFETAVGRTIKIAELWSAGFIVKLLGITAAAGILAGLYPAFHLSRIKPVQLLALSRTSRTSRSLLRKSLVFVQFALLGILMIGTLTIVRQMDFIAQTDRGLGLNNILLLNMYDQSIYTNREARLNAFKAALHSYPAVVGVSNPWGVPPRIDLECDVLPEGARTTTPLAWKWMEADANFLSLFSIPLVAGNNFSADSRSVAGGSVLINESAADLLGPGSPLGRRLSVKLYGRPVDLMVIGIVKDFHGRTLHHRIEPLLILYNQACRGVLSVKIGGTDRKTAVASVEKAWKSVFPDTPLDATFIDDFVKESYASEESIGRLGRIFSGMSVILACLGLFGLVAQSTKQRRREMGIRKVLGASFGDINWIFFKEFAKPVFVSNLIAWPVAYLWGRNWLQEFAYRSGLPWTIFLLTSFIAVFAALGTVGFQVLRASVENPAETLRCE